MSLNIGYKIEKLSVSLMFKGYQFINKIVQDSKEPDILWVYASRTTVYGDNNAVIKYNKASGVMVKIFDFGINSVYSITVSDDYVGVLSVPSSQPRKRYLTTITKSTGVMQSLMYEVAEGQALEFGNIYSENTMVFDGRYYWVIPNSSSAALMKVDTVSVGASTGVLGINAPGGSSLYAVTQSVPNWSPTASSFDNKAYVFDGKIYLFPKNAKMFTITISSNAVTQITNAAYDALSDRMEFSMCQKGDASDFSQAGQIILFGMRDSSAAEDPVNTIGMLDLVDMDFTCFKFADRAEFKGGHTDCIADNTKLIFLSILDGEKTGVYMDSKLGMFYEYALMSSDDTVFLKDKTPLISLSDDISLYCEAGAASLYKLTRTTPCRVIVRHIIEDGTYYCPEETLYGTDGSEYKAEQKIIEGKEMTMSSGAPLSGTFTAEDQVIEIHYAPVKVNTFVNVTLKDEDDNTLMAYTVEGYVGDDYSIDTTDVMGYTVVQVPSNASGTLAEANDDVVFTYRAMTDEELFLGTSFVSVSYESPDGSAVMPSVSKKYSIGDVYVIPAPTVPGHALTASSLTTGTCYDNTQYVRFEYTKSSGVGIARIDYVCNGDILKTEYVAGAIGGTAEHAASLDMLTHYTMSMTPFTVNLTEAISRYEIACTPKNPTITVKHTDVYDRSELFANEYIYLLVDGTIPLHAKIIDNYTEEEDAPTSASYNSTTDMWTVYDGSTAKSSVSGKSLEIEFLYDTVSSKVTTVYKIGETVLDTTEISGNNGDAYSTHPIEYEEYEVLSTDGALSGTIGSRDITVTYLYKARTCRVYVEYIDAAGAGLILKDTYTQDYGTTVSVPLKVFNGYTYLENSTSNEPNINTVTFTKEDQTIRYIYAGIDIAAQLKPELSVDKEAGGVRINVKTAMGLGVWEGLRYEVQKSEDGITYSNIFAKATVKVLNIVNSSTGTTTFTPYGGSPVTIPSKAILKKWCEEGNNGISVDYVFSRNFESDPEMYLRDIDGNYKYDVVVDGTYPDTERCVINDEAVAAVYKYSDAGYGYIDCSKKYKRANRADLVNQTPQESELLIKVINDMARTTGSQIIKDTDVTSTKPNEDVVIDNIQYDKIMNTINVKVHLAANGQNNAHKVYWYKVKLVNCNEGTSFDTAQSPAYSSIDCTLPILGYSMSVDGSQTTVPPVNPYGNSPLVYKRSESIGVIDCYIHVIGVDAFGNKTDALHTRYYKEITAEDLSNINSVITYSPKLVKENHRLRGPIESLKLNNFSSGVKESIEKLYSIIEGQKDKLASITGYDITEIHQIYTDIKDRSEI